MLGLMQSQPLLISDLIEFAERHHGDAEIVSRRVEGDIHRYTYKDSAQRARRVANALDGLKLAFGDRVATLAWNGYRHLELYFGVSGSGRVLHTLNPRLHPDLVSWIANHAEDQVLFFDMTFWPLIQAVASRCRTVRQWVAMTDRAHMPAAEAAFSIGTANPIPINVRASVGLRIAVTIPTTSPSAVTNGPPELPGFAAASN